MKQSMEALSQFVEIKTVALSSYALQTACQGIGNAIQPELPGGESIAGQVQKSPKAAGPANLLYHSRFMVWRQDCQYIS